MSQEFPNIRKTGPTMTVLRAIWNGGAGNEYHGYELAKQLKSHQSAYAIFRKLESHGLVSSRWEEVDGRRRRYYKLTGLGVGFCRDLFTETNPGGQLGWAAT